MKGTAMPGNTDLARHYDAEDLEDWRQHNAVNVERLRNWLGMPASDGCGVTYDY